jgi:D-glycero-D-manno-heptose 1,7-bisphosphate phosphatase
VRPAVFLDRDGTIIRHVHHLVDIEKVELLPGAAEGIRRLRNAGFVIVLVTNQSVVGRGMIDQAGLDGIHRRMLDLLADGHAFLDAIYWCGHAPDRDDEMVSTHPDRKPAPGMLLRAAAELDLDISRSWMIGDTIRDIKAGLAAGCRGSILLSTGASSIRSDNGDIPSSTVSDLVGAAVLIEKATLVATPNTPVGTRRPL